MKRLLFLLVSFWLFTTTGHSQTTYYGHKVGISVNFIGRKPLLAQGFENFFSDYRRSNYRYKSGKLEDYKNFDWGIETGITFFSRKKASFGLQFTYYNTDMVRQYDLSYYDQDNNMYYNGITAAEDLKFNSLTFMPMISVTSEELIKPIGLTHEFGLGYMSSTIVDKDYHFKMDGKTVTDENIFYDRSAHFKGVCAMYGLKLAKPLTKSLTLNFGLRYTLNFGNRNNTHPSTVSYGLDEDAKAGLNRNYVNAAFGLTLLL